MMSCACSETASGSFTDHSEFMTTARVRSHVKHVVRACREIVPARCATNSFTQTGQILQRVDMCCITVWYGLALARLPFSVSLGRLCLSSCCSCCACVERYRRTCPNALPTSSKQTPTIQSTISLILNQQRSRVKWQTYAFLNALMFASIPPRQMRYYRIRLRSCTHSYLAGLMISQLASFLRRG